MSSMSFSSVRVRFIHLSFVSVGVPPRKPATYLVCFLTILFCDLALGGVFKAPEKPFSTC